MFLKLDNCYGQILSLRKENWVKNTRNEVWRMFQGRKQKLEIHKFQVAYIIVKPLASWATASIKTSFMTSYSSARVTVTFRAHVETTGRRKQSSVDFMNCTWITDSSPGAISLFPVRNWRTSSRSIGWLLPSLLEVMYTFYREKSRI